MKKVIIHLYCICLTSLAIAQNHQAKESILDNPDSLQQFLARENVWGDSIFLGTGKKNKPVYAYFFNRNGTENAMLLAGMHGSEWYGSEVCRALIDSLRNNRNDSFYFKALIIPEVFPFNVDSGKNLKPNSYRKTHSTLIDPNRQMPSNKKLVSLKSKRDSFNRPIEKENLYLLYVIEKFLPQRIASIHCISNINQTGVFADTRTDVEGNAMDYHTDSFLAKTIAREVAINGGFPLRTMDSINVSNHSATTYRDDPPVADSGSPQKRKYRYEDDNFGETKGVSLGTWASSTIFDRGILKNAATMLTIELPHKSGFKRILKDRLKIDSPMESQINDAIKRNTNAYVLALINVFISKQ